MSENRRLSVHLNKCVGPRIPPRADGYVQGQCGKKRKQGNRQARGQSEASPRTAGEKSLGGGSWCHLNKVRGVPSITECLLCNFGLCGYAILWALGTKKGDRRGK